MEKKEREVKNKKGDANDNKKGCKVQNAKYKTQSGKNKMEEQLQLQVQM